MTSLSNIRVEYHQEVTINLGNFQNVKPYYAVSADVEEGGNPAEALKRLRSLVERLVEEEVSQIQADKLNG